MTDQLLSIVTVNVGSSSLKLASFRWTADGWHSNFHQNLPLAGAEDDAVVRALNDAGLRASTITGFAHRYVHAGRHLSGPAVASERMLAQLERTLELAPLHNPPALEWLRRLRARFPHAAHVIVPDSGYFHNLPAHSSVYAIPRVLSERQDLRRYGFHGLAHAAMWKRWSMLTGRKRARVITLQLGAGCSAAAIRNGRPVDTSMGFTPLEGLVMATRSGDIDPGLLLHLLRVDGLSPAELDNMLNNESGLVGLAGSGNMSELLERADSDAELAIDIFCRGARKYIGAFLAELGGVDALIFSGGIGEHCPTIRKLIVDRMAELGFCVDEKANASAIRGEARIGSGTVDIRVLPADEALELVRVATPLIRSNP